MFDLAKLKQEQLKLAPKVLIQDTFKKATLIGGAALAYTEQKILATLVVLNQSDNSILESATSTQDIPMPYQSSFLFYREGPTIIDACNKLQTKPDVLLLPGHGILHPRRIGMASQVGVLLDIPTIGVAKKLLLGDLREKTVYIDKEAVGYKFISREHARPIYVSPGHKISLHKSLEIVKESMAAPHKLPEPLHIAHRLVTKQRKELQQ